MVVLLLLTVVSALLVDLLSPSWFGYGKLQHRISSGHCDTGSAPGTVAQDQLWVPIETGSVCVCVCVCVCVYVCAQKQKGQMWVRTAGLGLNLSTTENEAFVLHLLAPALDTLALEPTSLRVTCTLKTS